MGFLDFLFKPKEELPQIVQRQEATPPSFKGVGTIPEKIKYSNKGVTLIKSSKSNPWQSYFSIVKKIDGKAKSVKFHIGNFSTKEEAQKARWEFIENLK